MAESEALTTSDAVAFVRTPDERFAGIDDYPYEPRNTDIAKLRMDFVMAEPRGAGNAAATILLLHGEQTWGYLYRTMISTLRAVQSRIVRPSFITIHHSHNFLQPSTNHIHDSAIDSFDFSSDQPLVSDPVRKDSGNSCRISRNHYYFADHTPTRHRPPSPSEFQP